MTVSSFLYTTCQAGAEPALKSELSRIHPDLRLAFSRPGFVTFKRADGEGFDPALELNSVFARTYGVSLGRKANRIEQVIEAARELESEGPLRLHFWKRERYPHGKSPQGHIPGALSDEESRALKELHGNPLFHADSAAGIGDLVFDVIVVEEGEWWLGLHRHSAAHSPFPGGRMPLVLPEESPSRAFLKLEEGVFWSGAPLRRGDVAVEIGSSPGGASLAMLKRGLQVVGVDPRTMSPAVTAHPGFKWIRKPAAAVLKEELPLSVQWLLLDMNVSPAESLAAVERFARWTHDSLLGMLLTVKLTNWSFAERIPEMMEQLRAMGMSRVRARQLTYNGQEFLLYGLSRKGQARTKTERD